MAYIGSIPAYQASGVRPRDEFTCDGTQICFALSQTVPGSFESSVTVVLDNVPQQPVEAFTVVDTKTLTFSAVTGTFTVNEVDPSFIVVTIDPDTVPTNSLNAITAIIDPYKFNPIATFF